MNEIVAMIRSKLPSSEDFYLLYALSVVFRFFFAKFRKDSFLTFPCNNYMLNFSFLLTFKFIHII